MQSAAPTRERVPLNGVDTPNLFATINVVGSQPELGARGVALTIKGDAPPENLQQIVEQSRARWAVFDVLTNGVPVEISVTVA